MTEEKKGPCCPGIKFIKKIFGKCETPAEKSKDSCCASSSEEKPKDDSCCK